VYGYLWYAPTKITSYHWQALYINKNPSFWMCRPSTSKLRQNDDKYETRSIELMRCVIVMLSLNLLGTGGTWEASKGPNLLGQEAHKDVSYAPKN
jgi:hypothetical protein